MNADIIDITPLGQSIEEELDVFAPGADEEETEDASQSEGGDEEETDTEGSDED